MSFDIDIILPTYNGEKFLLEQLNSIKNQINVQGHLWVRDDNSTDSSMGILKEFATNYPTQILPSTERLGVVGNVNELLLATTKNNDAGYFALADQDDFWYENKLQMQLTTIKNLEERYGVDTPLLVYSDARCVSSTRQVQQESFLQHLGIPKNWGSTLQECLIMSPALGCSCIGNAALRRMAIPLPEAHNIFMHDWWLLLVAYCFGKIHCVEEPLLDYRQHDGNVLGAKQKVSFFEKLKKMQANATRTQVQAVSFLQHFEKQLTKEHIYILQAWAAMPKSPYVLRRLKCFKHGFAKPGTRAFFT